MSVLSCLCRKVSLFFVLILGNVYFDFCCVLCSIEVPVPLIRKVSVFKQKCTFMPIDKSALGNIFPNWTLQVNFNLKSTQSQTFVISRNIWAATACGRDSSYSWFPTGENQFGPRDSTDTQVVSCKADCILSIWAMSVCLSLHFWVSSATLAWAAARTSPW